MFRSDRSIQHVSSILVHTLKGVKPLRFYLRCAVVQLFFRRAAGAFHTISCRASARGVRTIDFLMIIRSPGAASSFCSLEWDHPGTLLWFGSFVFFGASGLLFVVAPCVRGGTIPNAAQLSCELSLELEEPGVGTGRLPRVDFSLHIHHGNSPNLPYFQPVVILPFIVIAVVLHPRKLPL